MRFIFAVILSCLTLAADAAEVYQSTLHTKKLGTLTVVMQLDFEAGKTASSTKGYFQDQLDDGFLGKWVCVNSIYFDALSIRASVYDAKGKQIGEMASLHYNPKYGYLSLNDIRSSRESFECRDVTFGSDAEMQFEGFYGNVMIDGMILNISISPARVPATLMSKSETVYALNALNIGALVENAGGKIRFSIDVNRGYYKDTLESGSAKLISK
jgi:hypothetical protein